MSGLFELRDFPNSAFSFPKQVSRTLVQEKWLKKVPHKQAEQTFCLMGENQFEQLETNDDDYEAAI